MFTERCTAQSSLGWTFTNTYLSKKLLFAWLESWGAVTLLAPAITTNIFVVTARKPHHHQQKQTLLQHCSQFCSTSLVCTHNTRSVVTTRGEVRQLPQGAKWQGALLVDGLFALHYRIQPNF